MTLLVPTASTAKRIEVGPRYFHDGLEIKESELDWRENPYKPGEQYATVTVGEKIVGQRRLRRPEKLRFERENP